MKEYQKYLIALGAFVVIYAVGVILEDKLTTLLPEILQSIGGIGVVISAGAAAYKGFIKK